MCEKPKNVGEHGSYELSTVILRADGFQYRDFVKNVPDHLHNKTSVATTSWSRQEVSWIWRKKIFHRFLMCREGKYNNGKRIFTLNKCGCRILYKNRPGEIRLLGNILSSGQNSKYCISQQEKATTSTSHSDNQHPNRNVYVGTCKCP